MKTKLIELMAAKQAQTRRIIDATVIIEETGLTRPTVNNWINGRVRRFDEDTIVKLCGYFDCDIGDLLTIADRDDYDDEPPE